MVCIPVCSSAVFYFIFPGPRLLYHVSLPPSAVRVHTSPGHRNTDMTSARSGLILGPIEMVLPCHVGFIRFLRQHGGVNSKLTHQQCCVTSLVKKMRTRSQNVNNNYVKAPLTTETTTNKMVEPTRETAAVNIYTRTHAQWHTHTHTHARTHASKHLWLEDLVNQQRYIAMKTFILNINKKRKGKICRQYQHITFFSIHKHLMMVHM